MTLVRARSSLAVVVLAAMMLSSCLGFGDTIEIVESSAVAGPATVDPASAAAKISAYRKSKGLPGVTVSAKLNQIAASQAKAMASAGRMSHSLPGKGGFMKRMDSGGYDAGIAGENLAAGPLTLDQAMAAWKKSRGHNANLLKQGVTEIGIAVAHASKGKYAEYWALVLATPNTRNNRGGPDAGPAVAPSQ
jgi:uncharacterized protein YkwD